MMRLVHVYIRHVYFWTSGGCLLNVNLAKQMLCLPHTGLNLWGYLIYRGHSEKLPERFYFFL